MDLIKAISKLLGVQLVSRVISFAGLALFAQRLGAAELGIFFLFLSVIRLTTTLSNLGLRGALEKRLSERGGTRNYISTTIILKIGTLSASAFLIFVFQDEINSYLRMDLALLIIVAIVAEEAYQVVLHILRGELRVSRAADLRFLRQSSWVLGGIMAIEYFSMGVLGLIYAWILAAVVAFFAGTSVQSNSITKPTITEMKSLFRYGKYDVVSDAGSTLYNWFDIVIIGLVLTQTAVGAYETAWRVSAIAVIFGVAIREAIFPQVSAWSSDNDTEQIENLLTKMITASMFLVIPSFVGTLVLSTELLTFIFGQEFAIASTVLVILMGQKILKSISQVVGRTLQAIDKPDLAAYAMIVGVVLNIVLNSVLIISIGLVGAAIATGVSSGVMTVIQTMFLKKHLAVRFDWRSIGWCVISAIVMGGVIQLLRSIYRIDHILALLGLVAVGVATYFMIIFVSPTFRAKIINHTKMLIISKSRGFGLL